MRLKLIVDDGYVDIDGDGIADLDLTGIDPNIHAIQWYDTYGEVEYKDNTPNLTINDISVFQTFLDRHAIKRSTQDAVNNEQSTRSSKIDEIKAHALALIQGHLPTVDDVEDIELIRKVAHAFTISAAGLSAKDIYLYARTKIKQAQTAPIGQVESYDPTTDPGWPS